MVFIIMFNIITSSVTPLKILMMGLRLPVSVNFRQKKNTTEHVNDNECINDDNNNNNILLLVMYIYIYREREIDR